MTGSVSDPTWHVPEVELFHMWNILSCKYFNFVEKVWQQLFYSQTQIKVDNTWCMNTAWQLKISIRQRIILVWVILKEHFSLPHPLITCPGGLHKQSEMENYATLCPRWHKSELYACCGVYISFMTHKAVGHKIFEVVATYHVRLTTNDSLLTVEQTQEC